MPRERRLTPESLTDSTDQRHWKDSGPSRKGIFFKLTIDEADKNGYMKEGHGTFRILPDIAPRGAKGIPNWYYLQKQTFIHRPNKEGKLIPWGITNWKFMREEQPTAFAKLMDDTDWTEEQARDFFSEIGDHFGEDHPGIPKDKFGGSALKAKISCNCIVLPVKDDENDAKECNQDIKLYAMPWSVLKAIEKFRETQDQDGGLIEPTEDGDGLLRNHLVDVQYTKGRYSATFHIKPTPIRHDTWEDDLPSLEELSPNFMSYEDQIAHAQQAWPALFAPGGGLKDSEDYRIELDEDSTAADGDASANVRDNT